MPPVCKKPSYEDRFASLFGEQCRALSVRIDRIFGFLFAGQWLLGILLAFLVSPRSWAGELSQTHIHVYTAVFLGGLISALPIYLILSQPGEAVNRYVITVAQVFYSILFIHLMGGRIETHFHIFGSIAFIASYRDWRLVLLATAITAADHLLRGSFWPESVFGVLYATPWRSVEHSAWVVFEDIVLFFAIHHGLTELRASVAAQLHLEDALEGARNADRLASSYRSALDAFALVSVSDSHGVITSANENFCRLSKFEAEELIGQTHRIVNSGTHTKMFFWEMWNTISSGKVWEGEILNKAKDGSLYWVETTIVPLKDETGKVSEYLAARKDITLRKRLEEANAELNKNLESMVEERTKKWLEAEQKLTHATKMSALGEMAGGVAHEINNPLAVIRTVASQIEEIVLEPAFDPALVQKLAGKVTRTTDRIARIVQGLRTFSRDGSKDPFQIVKVRDLVTDTIGLCQERFKNHQVALKVGDLPDALSFEGRETQISQVLLNLLNNAYDAVVASPEPWVEITARIEADALEIRVTDSGSGIPADLQKKIFDPFFTTKEVGKGTGMGLSISLGILQAHHGQLFVDSSAPHTTFVIKLPLRQAGTEPSAA